MDTLFNPWKKFEISDSMIHEADVEAVRQHNSRVGSDYQFLDHLAPEPWIGDTSARVLVLLANPGATLQDVQRKPQKLASLINQLSIANLRGELKDYPHFFFDPRLIGSDGYNWYASRFAHLIKETSAQNVSQKILSCELVPYHSFSWRKPRLLPPTQQYTFNLVVEAMKRDAVILIGRGRAEWFKNVPGLEKYSRYFQPSSPQSAYVSPNNYGKNFEKILQAIQ